MHLWEMNNKSHVHSAPFSSALKRKPQIWCSSFQLPWFLFASRAGRGLTLPQSFPGYPFSEAVSICHCICSQGSGRQNENRKTVEVSGALPALQPPR